MDASEPPDDVITIAPDTETNESDLPSCNQCRRRKLKCSRQRPICSTCERLGMDSFSSVTNVGIADSL